ncbi:FadR/GntR family transcriptional regulator [Tianweitania sediminis]|uniref:FadR family transcriptional regulator n=1 Tax=Tianweitania sediminis TaxID=1502156 RepID=A0A8J7UJJ7_9HYPH|nr:FadR family transcriptional regulator [Tianweitania sediminis]
MRNSVSARYDRITVSSAYQKVAEAIEQQIIGGTLRPGDEVGTEAELVQQFGVNRSTVREGIRVLEQSGLVRREANRKLFVCAPRYRNLLSRMTRAMVLQEVTFRELFETAVVLETGAAEAAALRANPGDLQDLEGNLAEAEAVAHDPAKLAEVDSRFHALVARIAGNRVLELAREPGALLFFPTSELVCRKVPEGAGRMLQAHRYIIAAIRAGNADEARLWMRRHVVDWKRGFERAGHSMDEAVESLVAGRSPSGETGREPSTRRELGEDSLRLDNEGAFDAHRGAANE